MATIPLAANALHTEQANPLDTYARITQLKALLQQQRYQQQIQPLQAETMRQENQQRQMQLDQSQALNNAFKNALSTDESGNVSFDRGKVTNAIASAGAGAQIPGLLQKFNELDKSAADVRKSQDEHNAASLDYFGNLANAVKEAGYSPQAMGLALAHAAGNGYGKEAVGIQQQLSQNPNAIKPLVDQIISQSTKQRETASKELEAQTAANKLKAEMPGGVLQDPSKAEFQDYVSKGGVPSQYSGFKARQEASAVQPYMIQRSQAEGQARMAMEGMAKPVYAYDPRSDSTALMSQTEALQKGLQAIRPVTGKEVQDDTMLNNRLADVHQKIARYEQALQQPLSQRDKGNIAGLLGGDKLKVGAFGAELPVDRLNQAMDQENIKNLSPQARDAIISYYNAREAMVGYQRVLSGSGRSSEQAMQLNLQTLPSPAITDQDFANRSLTQFKENLRIVGQGIPKIPGIKSPQEWEQEITGPQRPKVDFAIPQPLTSPGRQSSYRRPGSASLSDLLGSR